MSLFCWRFHNYFTINEFGFDIFGNPVVELISATGFVSQICLKEPEFNNLPFYRSVEGFWLTKASYLVL